MPSTRPPRESSPVAASAPRVIAVVPTFHPDDGVVGRLRDLARQVDRVIVVDDGSGPSADAALADAAASGIEVHRLERNSGIAAALNTGVRVALDDGADYVVNVDQDTDLPEDYVGIALGIFARANAVTRLGIVAVDAVNGAPALPTWVSPEGFGLVPEAIQTGFVISRECLEHGGLFDERLVIDCVDTEYCLRVRDRGFRIAVAKGTARSSARSASRCATARAAGSRPTSTTRRSGGTTSRATTSTSSSATCCAARDGWARCCAARWAA